MGANEVSLKRILREANGLPQTLVLEDYRWLKGLRDAGVDGADELMDALVEYDSIRVWEE